MRRQNLDELIEFGNVKYRLKVLIDEPGYHLVILSIRVGLSIPEHATAGAVTVYAIRGHIVLYDGPVHYQLHAGEVISIAASIPHRFEAHEDSALLVLVTLKGDASYDGSEEPQLREAPHPHRQQFGFRPFDSLAIGDSMGFVKQIDMMHPGRALWEYT